jgi:hypothetical protein
MLYRPAPHVLIYYGPHYELTALVFNSFFYSHIAGFGTVVEPVPVKIRPNSFSNYMLISVEDKKLNDPKFGIEETNILSANSDDIILTLEQRMFAATESRKLLSQTEFPFKAAGATIASLGKIVTGRRSTMFHSQKYLWPVGFHSTRTYGSCIDPTVKTEYVSEILDAGESGALFRVTAADNGQRFEGNTPSAAWVQVVRAWNEAKKAYGYSARSSAVSGPEMYGFANDKIARLIEGLPDTEHCAVYHFRHFRQEDGKLDLRKVADFQSTNHVESVMPMEMEPAVTHYSEQLYGVNVNEVDMYGEEEEEGESEEEEEGEDDEGATEDDDTITLEALNQKRDVLKGCMDNPAPDMIVKLKELLKDLHLVKVTKDVLRYVAVLIFPLSILK